MPNQSHALYKRAVHFVAVLVDNWLYLERTVFLPHAEELLTSSTHNIFPVFFPSNEGAEMCLHPTLEWLPLGLSPRRR